MPTESIRRGPTMDDLPSVKQKSNKFRIPVPRGRTKSEDNEKKKQVQDYIAWVNNYLKRRPGCPHISDLRSGMQDGITIVHVVEIAANSEIPFIDRNPLSASARKANIEKAIAFLNSDGVHLSGDPAKDVIDGSIKGIMRIILAVAEKYNPKSVRPVAPQENHVPVLPTHSQQEVQFQGVPMSMRIHHSPKHERPLVNRPSGERPSGDRPSVSPRNSSSPPPPNFVTSVTTPTVNSVSNNPSLSQGYALSQNYPGSQPVGYSGNVGMGMSLSQPSNPNPQDGIYSTPIDSLPQHVTQKISSQMPLNRVIGQRSFRVPKPPGTGSGHRGVGVVEDGEKENSPERWANEVEGEIGGVLGQLTEFKGELLKLHSVLLDNSNGDLTQEEADISVPLQVATSELSTKDKKIQELEQSLKESNDKIKKLEREAETLRGMVLERNQFITTMKSEIYRKEYRNDTEKVDLQTQLLQKEKKVKVLEAEVSMIKASVEGKDRELAEMRTKLSKVNDLETELRSEVDKVGGQLTQVTSAGETLKLRIASRDRKIAQLEERLESEGKGFKIDLSVVSEDMDSIREQIVELRKGLDPTDLHQQTLDGLEKSISTMLTKLTEYARSLSPSRRQRKHHDEKREERRRRHKTDKPLPKEDTYVTATPIPPSSEWTKVFYYMTSDKSETPYVTSVPRKPNEVRLRDFKAVFDRHGSYRFYVKSSDPDCGVVREEIIQDDAVLPTSNGKLILWVSEKAHHYR